MEVKYDAITLDTSIFRGSGYKFHSGLLAQLKQFGHGPARLVLSEIVTREVYKHLCDETTKVRNDFLKSLKRSVEVGLVQQEHIEAPDSIVELAKSTDPNDLAESIFEEFIEKCNAEVIPITNIDIQTLVDMYFEPSAPFEPTGKKKREFPDAIALLSIEEWAKANNKKILAVSKDSGWKRYGEISNNIDVDDDLSSALSRFQKDAEVASSFVAEIVSDMSHGKLRGLYIDIEKYLSDKIPTIDFDIYGSSDFYAEPEGPVDVELVDVEFSRFVKSYDIALVHCGPKRITAKIGLYLTVNATAEFSIWIDGDLDSYHSSVVAHSKSTDAELTASVLVTFEGDFAAQEMSDLEVTEVGLLDITRAIDFGDIVPSFSGHLDENLFNPDIDWDY